MESLLENIRVALSAIRMNMVRAIITIFIIAFGIMSLISMLTAMDGIRSALYSNFAEVGSNTFTIQSQDPVQGMRRRGFSKQQNAPITYHEALSFQSRFQHSAKVSISYDAAGDAVVEYAGTQTAPKMRVVGGDQSYMATSGLQLEDGRNFTDNETRSGRKVVIIGHKLKEDMFGPRDALGKHIQINGVSYMVLGWLVEKGNSFGQSPDNIIIMPLLAAQASFPANEETDYKLAVQVGQIERLDDVINDAMGAFRAVRRLKISEENDFYISKSDSLADVLTSDLKYVEIIAIAIGIITLIGAAVALTNIMLVSVTERTREIGVRKALGATRSNIMRQFLLEAVMITFLGGIVGVIIGVILGNIVARYFEGNFVFPVNWTLLGLSICIVVGIFAGLYPAAKASRQDPVEALRYE